MSELPEWKVTSKLLGKIKTVNIAVIPPKNSDITFCLDESLLKEVFASPLLSALKVRNGVFQFISDYGEKEKEIENGTQKELFSKTQSKLFIQWGNNDFSYFELKESNDKTIVKTKPGEYPRRLQLAETGMILKLMIRTSKFAIVIDCYDDNDDILNDEDEDCDNMSNISAAFRTAECLGIQYIYIVLNRNLTSTRIANIDKTIRSKISRGTHVYLNVNIYPSFSECYEILQKEKRELWIAQYHYEEEEEFSVSLNDIKSISNKIAVVIPLSEKVNPDIFQYKSQLIHYPLFGFSNKLTFSIFSALIMQQLFMICPEARGDITEDEKKGIRATWYELLSKKNTEKKKEFLSFLNNPPPVLHDLRDPELFSTTRGQLWTPNKIRKRINYTQGLMNTENENNNNNNNNNNNTDVEMSM